MKTLRGLPASPGLAVAPARVLLPSPAPAAAGRRRVPAEDEIERLNGAVADVRLRLEALTQSAEESLAEVVAIQLEMLSDPELLAAATAAIEEGQTAEAAITTATARLAAELAEIPDAYLAARAEDVSEVGRHIVRELQGGVGISLNEPAILVAGELAPSELLELGRDLVRGIVTERGSPTGHLAIVCQGLGIPAAVGTPNALDEIDDASVIVLDGDTGTVIATPDEESLAMAGARLEAGTTARGSLEMFRAWPGRTADGVRVEVFANVSSLVEIRRAAGEGAEGVGLFRTELLLEGGLPNEEEQFAVYNEAVAILGRPLVVRTFDIGGDKPVPGLDLPPERNPFLGMRGLRLALDRPELLFLPQIRALLRAAAQQDIRIMLPMVTVPEEVEAARRLIAETAASLARSGLTHRIPPTGIMVETPAAALTLDRFVGLIDFASIGTNDLVQYTYAADRTQAAVAELARPLGLATLRLLHVIGQVKLPLAVCGGMAANPEAIPLLVGLGVRELSVPPPQVPAVKRVLARYTLDDMRQMASERLGARPLPRPGPTP